MAQKATIQLRLTHKLVMTPSLQYAIKLLPMTKLELQETVNVELAENPVLEEALEMQEPEEEQEGAAAEGEEAAVPEVQTAGDTGEASSDDEARVEAAESADGAVKELDTKPEHPADEFDDFDIENFFSDYQDEPWRPPLPMDVSDLPSFENTLSVQMTLSDHLLWQLDCTPCTDHIKDIGIAIIGNLDEDGYLRVELDEIVAMGDYTLAEVEEALALVQQFDPPGVAARSLSECLRIQLHHIGLSGTVTENLLLDNLDLVEARDDTAICQRLACSQEDLQHHLDIIRHLDPQPGLKYSATKPYYVVPDVYVVKVENDFVVILNEEGLPRLRISPVYSRMLASKALQDDQESRKYIRERFKSALWLIKSLDQRQRTIYKVSESIVRHQRDFLEKGKGHLRPMVLHDVADDIGVHESTVGRVVANKYMQTPQGTLAMKFFFNRGLSNDRGESISTINVKQRIRDLVSTEAHDGPLSDSAIAALLRNDKLRIARRTVAKYRDELKIPPSHLRRSGGTVTPPQILEGTNLPNLPRSEDKS